MQATKRDCSLRMLSLGYAYISYVGSDTVVFILKQQKMKMFKFSSFKNR